MEFFEAFPLTYYRFSNTEDPILITHILRRFNFRKTVKDLVANWDTYIIASNETPEQVAYNVYGNSGYHWIILMFNDIVDPFTDWVMNDDTLVKYVTKNYSNIDAVHHYSLNGRVVPSNVEGSTATTNYEYEVAVNESKRKIRIPKTIHIKAINDELEKVLKEIH